jgi:hypothetical protein
MVLSPKQSVSLQTWHSPPQKITLYYSLFLSKNKQQIILFCIKRKKNQFYFCSVNMETVNNYLAAVIIIIIVIVITEYWSTSIVRIKNKLAFSGDF